jgi:hypothetical protein
MNSSLRRLWFSSLVFPFYKMLLMNRHEFSCFTDFPYMDFRVECGLLLNPPESVNSPKQKTRDVCQIYVKEIHLWGKSR